MRPQLLRHWYLHQDNTSGMLAAYDDQGGQIHDLILKPLSIQKVQRSPYSEKLVIHKHKYATAKGSTKVFLEFVTTEDARQICDVLKEHDSTILFVVLDSAQLDRKFVHIRKIVDSREPKTPQTLRRSGTRAVETRLRQTEDTKRRGQEGESARQQGASVDRQHPNEPKDSHGNLTLRKRKLPEDASSSRKGKTSTALRSLRSSRGPNNDCSDGPADACRSNDPDSFYGNRGRLSFSIVDDEEPTVRSSSPLRWTEKNQNWAKSWKGPVVYPRQGDKKSRTTVELNDVERLDEGQYLNDNIINFYLSWLAYRLGEESPKLAKRVYFHNTFFYKTLTQGVKGKRGINYEAVERWTSKCDLLSFDYIIIPINEDTHWYVAIICNAARLHTQQVEGSLTPKPAENRDRSEDLQDHACKNRLVDSGSRSLSSNITNLLDKMSAGQRTNQIKRMSEAEQRLNASVDLKEQAHVSKDNYLASKKRPGRPQALRKFDPLQPRIITLDSLGLKHSPTCTNLKNYLVAEIKAKKKISIPVPGSLGATAVNIPRQTNYVDCGLFLLNYVEQFLKDPDKFIHDIFQARDYEIVLPTASFMRDHIRQILFDLQEDQGRDAEASREKKCNNKHAEKPETGLNSFQKDT
ncbi:hypothetical protein ONS95_002389 [Cadophora gregata]|uniref:uncharacterized protein n=1 Tax=Cadophora gregata TaxID=51156 RepID=UPI0026DD4C4E|nr:uncharacterized protein ONS95_002389 [Cadophora gregata]KAK0109710.1 hypothetical protein ONS95_002389 [Cadophora gregata]KAK0110657.1 hypothetical protein ONS96_002259 [Cadophora gregata f. sp. sojae]